MTQCHATLNVLVFLRETSCEDDAHFIVWVGGSATQNCVHQQDTTFLDLNEFLMKQVVFCNALLSYHSLSSLGLAVYRLLCRISGLLFTSWIIAFTFTGRAQCKNRCSTNVCVQTRHREVQVVGPSKQNRAIYPQSKYQHSLCVVLETFVYL